MWRELLRGLVDLVWPKRCLACKKGLGSNSVDNLVCRECWAKIKRNLPPFCYSCGRHLEKKNLSKNICPACIKEQPYFDRAFSPCVYEGVLKELIHSFKYQGKDYLGSTLSKLMNEFIQEYNLPMDFIDFIIPVPLHKTRLREREFNQAEILAKFIAGQFHKELACQQLQRQRYTPSQTELTPQQRLRNVQNSFSVTQNYAFKSKNILLIDDVFTTGATASWAAYALKQAGANIVFVLTLAS